MSKWYNLSSQPMLAFPNAKINLGLQITRKRPDGFHDLETIFYPINTHQDVLELVPAGTPSSQMFLSGLSVAGDYSENLAWRAFQRLKSLFPLQVPELDIYLHKAIPMGAGLGGGSADAAFMLRMINEYCSLKLSQEYLEGIALELGSDCPFFLRNTAQFARGRGEIMQAIELDLSNYDIKIICPPVHVSTRAAFSNIRPQTPSFELQTLPNIPLKFWKDHLKNDFEEPVLAQYPIIKEAKEQLYAEGALYAAMSGSGSAVFGIFPK